jgi:hypothetical protein
VTDDAIAAPPKVGPAPVPAAYASAVKAKLERDRKSYSAFRAIDQQQHDLAHEQRVTEAVATAEDEVRLWHLDLEELEPEAAEALAGFRAAEDRARVAREFARQQLEAYELIKGKGSPAEETEALIRADTADQVAINAAKVMEGKQAELAAADQSLAESREGLAAAERELDRVKKAAGIPAGAAPISDVTIRANAAYMQADEIWDTLSNADKQRVRNLAEPRGMLSDREFWAMTRQVLAIGGSAA